MYKSFYADIDVSKKSMDVAVCKDGVILKKHRFCVENSERGYRLMISRPGKMTGGKKDGLPFCMEHTGIYTLTFQCLPEKDRVAYTMLSPLHLKKSL
jgi:hypothetical protein